MLRAKAHFYFSESKSTTVIVNNTAFSSPRPTQSGSILAIYHAVDAALKKQILAATEETYLISLKDHNTGFARVTTRTIIEHLYTN